MGPYVMGTCVCVSACACAGVPAAAPAAASHAGGCAYARCAFPKQLMRCPRRGGGRGSKRVAALQRCSPRQNRGKGSGMRQTMASPNARVHPRGMCVCWWGVCRGLRVPCPDKCRSPSDGRGAGSACPWQTDGSACVQQFGGGEAKRRGAAGHAL
ncbi:MAG: hypothetical protein J3K34DRAFT_422392 [Monoraphidium minutum]|nr:MAG: hypothetical protein J3K34DRAFT_422392 [Monoraphidium minutum]